MLSRSLSGWMALMIAAVGAERAGAQTCGRPASECAGTLHCGGQWDFETGFYITDHALAGQCQGPPTGGNVFCVPPDKWAQVGNGWTHWASFPTWATGGFWGTCSSNENKNCDNVFRGNRSQELTMTCANGVGVIYKQAAVPASHVIRVEADMKFTPNGDWVDVEHAIGIDPSGGTNPASPAIQWTQWQQQTPSPPQAGGVFNRGTAQAVSQGSTITVFIRQRAFEPPCAGQTFMIDNVKVFDAGASGPFIELMPSTIESMMMAETSPPAPTFTVRNSGTGTMAYTITNNAAWLTVSPSSGSSSGNANTHTLVIDAGALSPGVHHAVVTVTSASAPNSPKTLALALTVNAKPADLDGDGDVDLDDFGRFQTCFSGNGLPYASGCRLADLDGDVDVDTGDFVLFHGCMSGSRVNSQPGCLP